MLRTKKLYVWLVLTVICFALVANWFWYRSQENNARNFFHQQSVHSVGRP